MFSNVCGTYKEAPPLSSVANNERYVPFSSPTSFPKVTAESAPGRSEARESSPGYTYSSIPLTPSVRSCAFCLKVGFRHLHENPIQGANAHSAHICTKETDSKQVLVPSALRLQGATTGGPCLMGSSTRCLLSCRPCSR